MDLLKPINWETFYGLFDALTVNLFTYQVDTFLCPFIIENQKLVLVDAKIAFASMFSKCNADNLKIVLVEARQTPTQIEALTTAVF